MTAPLRNQLVVSFESQCFPQPELGTRIFVYLITHDKTLIRCRMGPHQPLYEEVDAMLSYSLPPIQVDKLQDLKYLCIAELQKTLVKFKGLEILLLRNRAYTKHQDIYDQESFRKSGFLYSALQSPIQYCMVTASDIEISSLLNRNPLNHNKKSKIFFAIGLNLLIYHGH